MLLCVAALACQETPVTSVTTTTSGTPFETTSTTNEAPIAFGWQRSERNPVVPPSLPREPRGTQIRFPDERSTGGPSVRFNDGLNLFQMWYDASDGLSNDGSDRDPVAFGLDGPPHIHSESATVIDGMPRFIAYATSEDGVSWTKWFDETLEPATDDNPRPVSPILPSPAWGDPDGTLWEGGVMSPSVLIDPNSGVYRMWFVGISYQGISTAPGDTGDASGVNYRSRAHPGLPCDGTPSDCADPFFPTDSADGHALNCAVYRMPTILTSTSVDGIVWDLPTPAQGLQTLTGGFLTTGSPLPDGAGRYAPHVIYDTMGTFETDDDLWRMWYTGLNSELSAMYFNSGQWTCYNSPTYTGDTIAPYIFDLLGARAQFFEATSTDGVTWTSDRTILPVASAGLWDRAYFHAASSRLLNLAEMTVMQVPGNPQRYLMFYAGGLDAGSIQRLGVTHGERSDASQFIDWVEAPGDPFDWERESLFGRSSITSWDNGGLGAPSALIFDEQLFLYFEGLNFGIPQFGGILSPNLTSINPTAIGLATIPVSDLPPFVFQPVE